MVQSSLGVVGAMALGASIEHPLALVLAIVGGTSAWTGLAVISASWTRTVESAQLTTMPLIMISILLSGFAFPFRGMPGWAQVIGEALPTTHFLRVVRGLMLKGATASEVGGEILVLVLLLVIVSVLALSRYRVTLD